PPCLSYCPRAHRTLLSFPTRRSSDLPWARSPLDPDFVPYTCALTTALCGKPTLMEEFGGCTAQPGEESYVWSWTAYGEPRDQFRSEEHTSELQSRENLVCRLLLEKKQ